MARWEAARGSSRGRGLSGGVLAAGGRPRARGDAARSKDRGDGRAVGPRRGEGGALSPEGLGERKERPRLEEAGERGVRGARSERTEVGVGGCSGDEGESGVTMPGAGRGPSWATTFSQFSLWDGRDAGEGGRKKRNAPCSPRVFGGEGGEAGMQ